MSKHRRRRRRGGGNRRFHPRNHSKKPGKFRRFARGIFTNRYNPNSRWVSIGDITTNFKEWWYSFWNEVPRGSNLYWRKGKVVGHSTRSRWPR